MTRPGDEAWKKASKVAHDYDKKRINRQLENMDTLLTFVSGLSYSLQRLVSFY